MSALIDDLHRIGPEGLPGQGRALSRLDLLRHSLEQHDVWRHGLHIDGWPHAGDRAEPLLGIDLLIEDEFGVASQDRDHNAGGFRYGRAREAIHIQIYRSTRNDLRDGD